MPVLPTLNGEWEALAGTVSENVVKGSSVIAAARSRLVGRPMSETMVNPCMQESEAFPGLYAAIQAQREQWEEIASFEMAAKARGKYVRAHGRDCKSKRSVDADLCSLGVHSAPPLISGASLLPDCDTFHRSQQGYWRSTRVAAEQVPLDFLVARPVSRSEFLENPLAMEAYWKEWTNLEERKVWRRETLT